MAIARGLDDPATLAASLLAPPRRPDRDRAAGLADELGLAGVRRRPGEARRHTWWKAADAVCRHDGDSGASSTAADPPGS